MGAGYAAARVARLATLGFDELPPPLTWDARLGAVLDVMEALVYLHTPAEVTLTPHPHHIPNPDPNPNPNPSPSPNPHPNSNQGKAVELHCDVKPSNMLLSRTPDGELVAS